MEEFLTPESSANPNELRTPGIASEAASSSGGDGNNGSALAGKKRSAPSADSDDSDDDSVDISTSFFGRIVSSVTPWRRKNRRARTSLDSMSGSAIKSASRLPASEDSNRSRNNGGSGKKSLEKLNLEHKFDSTPAADNAASVDDNNNDVPAVPVQMANNINEESARPAKRVRLAENPFTSTTTNDNANNGEKAIKSVRIGGTTFVSSTTPNAATGPGNGRTVKFDDVTTPKFNIGTTKLKDVRGRNLTPARGMRSKWGTGTPSSRSSVPQDGMRSTSSTASSSINRGGGGGYQRRSIQGLSITSRRGTNNRRRGISSRNFKPMNNLLGQIYAPSTTNDEKSKKKLLISQNIADQILGDRRNKLFQSSVVDRKDNLFGIATSNNFLSGTNEKEQAAQYKAVTNKVPRIRMNRVMGSGQTGSRLALPAPAATTATAMISATPHIATATGVAGTTPSIPPQPSIAAKVTIPKATSTLVASTKNAFVAPKLTANETALSAKTSSFVPFKPSGPISDRGEGETKLFALEADVGFSQETFDGISRNMKDPKWRKASEANNPFSNVGEATVTPKKRKATSQPKKGSGSDTTLVSGSIGGAPFSFMPGGAAASSKVDTPAFNYKETKVLSSSTPAKPKTPAKSLAPAATDTSKKSDTTTTSSSSGWGDIFKAQSDMWKCTSCFSQNPMDKDECMSCGAEREGYNSKADAEPLAGKNDAAKKGSVGTGGFTFGAPSSSPAPAPATSTAGSIGAGGFSFSGTSSSTSISAPAIKFGATPSKAAEKKDDTKATTGATGFSFGTATPAKTKPSTSGFTFSATSTKESKNGGSEEKKDDTPKKSLGFGLGASTASSSTPSTSKANATFSFDQSAESTGVDENKGDTANTGGFKFGSTSSNPKPKRVRDDDNGKQDSAKKASSSSKIAFGSGPTSNKSLATSSFLFDAGTKKEEAPPASTSIFSFGSTSTETKINPSTSSFEFGSTPAPALAAETKSAAASTVAPAFSFSQSAPSNKNVEKEKPAFTFSQPTSATSAPEKKDVSAPNPAPVFGVGAAAPSNTTTAAPTAPAPAAPFQFGSQTPAPAAAPFGGSGFGTTQQPAAPQPAAPAPAFGFSVSAQTPAPVSTPASTFGFGGSAQAVAAPAPTPAFTFGSSAAAPPPAFGMPPAATPAPAPAAPAFGMSSAPAPAPTGFGGSFGMSQAPAPAMNGGGFSMGVGGGAKKAAGGRRIVRARRPPGSRR